MADIHTTFVKEMRELVEANNRSMPDALYEKMLIRIGDQELFTKKFSFQIIRFTCEQEEPGNDEVRCFQENRADYEDDMLVRPPKGFVKTYHSHFTFRPKSQAKRLHFPISHIMVALEFMIKIMGEKLLRTEVASSLEPKDMLENFKPSEDYTTSAIQLIMFKKGIIRCFVESMLEAGEGLFSPEWRPILHDDDDGEDMIFLYRKPIPLQFNGFSLKKMGQSYKDKTGMVSINYVPELILNMKEERDD